MSAIGLRVHASCVEIDGIGVLLRGGSGSGKSDLALRLIDQGARLVADDQVILERAGSALLARAPETLHGLIEVRGLGILRLDAAPDAVVALVIDLVAPDRVPRLPDPLSWDCEGVGVPVLSLAPFETSAPLKVRLAVKAVTGDIMVVS